MAEPEPLIPRHGGYQNLKTFQFARLVYDLTARFCDRHVGRRSRTHGQMVQAARSGVQNIAERSQASGTSKKMELKLTNAARASLEELRLDYQDYLRHNELPEWEPGHPAPGRFRAQRCSTLDGVRPWVHREHAAQRGPQAPAQSVPVRGGPCQSLPYSAFVANAALSLLNLCCHLLDRQVAAHAKAFEAEGGFTERLCRVRKERRRRH